MNRTSVFAVFGFSSLILLAAVMVWYPSGKSGGQQAREVVAPEVSVASGTEAAAVPVAVWYPRRWWHASWISA